MNIRTAIPVAAALLAAHLLVAAARPLTARADSIPVDTLRLRAHVSALSDDSMAGRRAGYAGERKAAEYIAHCLFECGATLWDSSGSYFQPFPIPRGLVYSTSMLVIGDDTLRYPGDFAIFQGPTGPVRVSEEMVFVGFGIHRPDLAIDSYRDLDVTGRTVVALAPGLWIQRPELKDVNATPPQMAQWARELGAAAILILDTGTVKHGSQRPGRRVAAELFDPIDSTGFLWVSVADGQRFLATHFAVHDLATVDITTRHTASLSVSAHLDMEPLMSANVAGLLEGTDFKEQVIVLSAHYDHLGTTLGRSADSIYNGAMDNASGVAALLEAARILCARNERPRRSILFLATGAEETGLVGSRYFVQHVPAGVEVVANVNLDVLGFSYRGDECCATLLGAEYSDMREVFASAAGEAGVGISSNYLPSYFYRSDGISFANAGIPSIAPASGLARASALDAIEYFQEFYHQPNDELGKAPLDVDVLQRQTHMIATALWSLATQQNKPQWTASLDSESWLTLRDSWGQFRMWFAKHLF